MKNKKRTIVIKVKSDRELLAKIRGQSVRPAQQHRDRRLDANRRHCRTKPRRDSEE